jgi:hypothetical protein
MADTKFHAIKITSTKNCCDNAREVGNRLILSNEFEKNILANCDRAQCECSFKHFTDRRQNRERRDFSKKLEVEIFAIRTHPYGRRSVDVHNMSRDAKRKYLLTKQTQPF